MSDCPSDLIDAAVDDRLSDEQDRSLQSHLSSCEICRKRLEETAASPAWWDEAHRLLEPAALDDPGADKADSSALDARLFEADDPVGELKAAGVIDRASHPEMLGQLGRYSIEREIGTGGMGVVLKGFDAELNRTVAIKVLAPHLARSGAARQRFIREGRAAAAVVHENVVAIHEVDTSRRLPTLVMRYVDGVSLQRRVDTVGPLPVTDALRIAAQTAAGLSAAHRQGIVHRDVKPGNVLVSGSGGRVWITDFGLARAVDDASLTRTGFIAGTPHYMSPEQARGASVGPASDLFSLGGVIYFTLAGRPPWRAEVSLAVLHRIVQEPHRPLWQLNPEVPREVSDLVDTLLSKDPGDRGGSATEVQQRLESILSDLQNPAGPHSLKPSERSGVPDPKVRIWNRPLFLVPATAVVTALLLQLPQLRQSADRRATATDNWNARPLETPLPASSSFGVSNTVESSEATEYDEASVAAAFAAPISESPSNFTDNPVTDSKAAEVGRASLGTSPNSLSLPSFPSPSDDQTTFGSAPLQGTFGSESPVGQPALDSGFANAPTTAPVGVPADLQAPKHSQAPSFGSPNPIAAPTLDTLPPIIEPQSTIADQHWLEITDLETLLDQAESMLAAPSVPPTIGPIAPTPVFR